jgi:hypothetical protein
MKMTRFQLAAAVVSTCALLTLPGCGGGGDDSSFEISDGSWTVQWSATVAVLTLHADADGNISGTIDPVNGGGATYDCTGYRGDSGFSLHVIMSDVETEDFNITISGTNVTGTVTYKHVGYTPTVWQLTGVGEWTPVSQPAQPDTNNDLPDTGGKYITFLDSNVSGAAFTMAPDGKLMKNTLSESIGITITCSQNGTAFTMSYLDHGVVYGDIVGTATAASVYGTLYHVHGGGRDSGHSFNALPAATTSSAPYGWVSF